MRAADEKWLPIFQEAGLTAVNYTDEELQRWRDTLAKPLWAEWVAQQNAAGRDGQKRSRPSSWCNFPDGLRS